MTGVREEQVGSWDPDSKCEEQRPDRITIVSFSHTPCQEVGDKIQTVGAHMGYEGIKGKIREIVRDLKGTTQKENRIVVQGRGKQQRERLEKLLDGLQGRRNTL